MSAPVQCPPASTVFVAADYDGLELRTMAQACLLLVGESRLAEVLNSGRDPHLMMAANMLGLSYEEAERRHKAENDARTEAYEFFKGKRPDGSGRFIPTPFDDNEAFRRAAAAVPTPVDDARQAGKVADFGFPGGLGPEKLVLFARKTYKVRLVSGLEGLDPTGKPTAKELKGIWLSTFPEFRRYFKAIDAMQGDDGATFRHFFSGRMRGRATYTAACNSFFQGLGSDATGNALFLISEACYVALPCHACGGHGHTYTPNMLDSDPDCDPCLGRGVNPLYGCRLVNYVHDDFLVESPEERAHEAAHELVRLMIAGAAPYLPNVPATAKPKVMRFLSKDAKQVWENTPKGKRLVAWPKAA